MMTIQLLQTTNTENLNIHKQWATSLLHVFGILLWSTLFAFEELSENLLRSALGLASDQFNTISRETR